MSREQQIQALAMELLEAVDAWARQLEQNKNEPAEQIVKRTSMQAGIHDSLHLVYANGKAELYEWLRDYGSSDYSAELTSLDPALTEEEARRSLAPLLAEGIRRIMSPWLDTPLIDYRFTVSMTVDGSPPFQIVELISEDKREWLLERIHTYIRDKLEAGQYPTKPLDSFFLARHIVDPGLFPELDAAFVLRVYDSVMERNKTNPEKLSEHRGSFIREFRKWAEETFLPVYYVIDKPKWGPATYTKRETASTAVIPEQHHILALKTAFLIIRHEPSYSRQGGLDLLDRLRELGSAEAERMVKEGSGALPAEIVRYRDERVDLQAHDLFAVITVQIRQENADSYGRALDFICRLLQTGAFRSYQIKLKSQAKHMLEIRGLAKSQTHRFFANALQYPELYPQLERYARLAMTEFEWYTDSEGEKCCMPGTYAVFGLGLADIQYFPLVQDYMRTVDVEHQSVQVSFASALMDRYGVDSDTLPTVAACLASCSDGKFAKYRTLFETPDNLRTLSGLMLTMEPHTAWHLAELIWGGADKLTKLAKSKKGEEAEDFAAVAAAACRRK